MFDIFTIFGKLKAAWDKVHTKRRARIRPALRALAEAAFERRNGVDNLVEDHLESVLEASFPIGEVGGDLLRGAADALEGKK